MSVDKYMIGGLAHKSKHVDETGQCRDDKAVPSTMCLIHERVNSVTGKERNSDVGHNPESQLVVPREPVSG